MWCYVQGKVVESKLGRQPSKETRILKLVVSLDARLFPTSVTQNQYDEYISKIRLPKVSAKKNKWSHLSKKGFDVDFFSRPSLL